MQAYISQLADINKRLHDAINQLREQQRLVSDIDCPRRHQALLMLLSNGLRGRIQVPKETPEPFPACSALAALSSRASKTSSGVA
jgi:hypothetical protein